MNTLQRLRSLAGDPARQAAEAIALLDLRARADARMAVLEILDESPAAEAREPLLILYAYLAQHGPKRDPGAHTRAAVFQQAVMTYEFLPPDFLEDAAVLRAGALLALAKLDDPTTDFHAARLIVDEHTAPMSGEPALTAVRVPANRRDLVPLFEAAMSGFLPPEIVSASLQSLTSCPAELLPTVVAGFRDNASDVILLGLIDLLIDHDSGPQELEHLSTLMLHPLDAKMYQYLVVKMLSSRNEDLLAVLAHAVRLETNAQRLHIVGQLLDTLGLVAAEESLRPLLTDGA